MEPRAVTPDFNAAFAKVFGQSPKPVDPASDELLDEADGLEFLQEESPGAKGTPVNQNTGD